MVAMVKISEKTKTGKCFLHNGLDVRGKQGQMAAAEQINVHSVVISFSPKEKFLVEGERLAPLSPFLFRSFAMPAMDLRGKWGIWSGALSTPK